MENPSHIVLSANVVVLAQFHNPSILNPDFLKINKIVDGTWDVAETITTTPFSQTRFKNDISMTVDNERLNITQIIKGDYQEVSPIYDMASNYTKILEHVKYTAMGLNWDILVPTKDSSSWMIEHFLKKTSIPKSGPAVEGINLMMKFTFLGNAVSFHLAPEERSPVEGNVPFDGVRVRANIHYAQVNAAEIRKNLQTWKEVQQFIKKQINKLIH